MKYFSALVGILAIIGMSACGDNSEKSSSSTANAAPPTDNQSNQNNTNDSSAQPSEKTALTKDVTLNPVAYIPPQCYTDTKPAVGTQAKNPCYVCHTTSKKPNYLNDVDVQLEYSIPDPAQQNHWTNLFEDKTDKVSKISDDDILTYVKTDNYKNAKGEIILASKLNKVPKAWDRNQNGTWEGYTPDAYFNFDGKGFDTAPNGQRTGWRVFAYYPFPGTFMPTNGSTDDVLIRLPVEFQQDKAGNYSEAVYELNLAIIESLIKRKDITINEVDEVQLGLDVDKNGKLSKAGRVTFDWAPLEQRFMYYAGKAGELQKQGKIKLAAGLFPVGTEFLHSVRYIDIKDGKVMMAPRMKELRYGRKHAWRDYYQLQSIVDDEVKERHDFSDRTKTVLGNMEDGLRVSHGWTYQGFIEDARGDLRPQTYEETYFCTGCHGGVGANTDTTFSYYRKLEKDNFKQGWYHWLEKGFKGLPDRTREDGKGEYAYYLTNNPTGNEYRTNDEVYRKFHLANGEQNAQAFAKLKTDISELLVPSKARALMLNKAYKVIVDEQRFDKGREAHVKPMDMLLKELEADTPTHIKEPLSYH